MKKRTRRKPAKKNTVPMPERDTWKDAFQQQTLRTDFTLRLTQSMIEFLCATADDCHWDRVRDSHVLKPDNFLGTKVALTRRGLIVAKRQRELPPIDQSKDFWSEFRATYELTPAGEAVVELFRVTGVFVESENAEIRRLGG